MWKCVCVCFTKRLLLNNTVRTTCVCMLGRFSCVRLFATPWTEAHRLLCPWDSPGKNTRVDCHFFLQEIFLTQGSKLCHLRLLHCRQILYHLNKGSPVRTTVKWKRVCVYNCNSSRYSLKSANDYSKDTKTMHINL